MTLFWLWVAEGSLGVFGEEVVASFLVCGDCHDRVAALVDDHVLTVEAIQSPALTRTVPCRESVSLVREGSAGSEERVVHAFDPLGRDELIPAPASTVTKQPTDARKFFGA